MKYEIAADLMEKLQTKLTKLENKCNKYSCKFLFTIEGETFKKVTVDEHTFMQKFFKIDVEGIARINDWEFVATLEHKVEGNIVRTFGDREIPQEYYTCKPTCEHCNTNRYRKDTYLIYNSKTESFMQVGKACLKDFTANAMNADMIALYLSYFNSIDEVNDATPDTSFFTKYIDRDSYLGWVYELTRIYGYISRDKAMEYGKSMTASDAYELYSGKRLVYIDSYGMTPDSEEAKAFVDASLTWIANSEETSGYLWNLKLACENKYTEMRDKNLVASLIAAYFRHTESEKNRLEREARKSLQPESKFIDRPVGFKLDTPVESAIFAGSYGTQFGVTHIYKFLIGDSVLVWKTGVSIETEKVTRIRGTIKEFNEYKGEKQTVLTRCKIS